MPDPRQNVDVSDGTVARRVSALRLAAGLSKAELADRAGLTYRTVHDIERGTRRRVQEKTLLVLADALEVPLAEIVGPRPDASAETAAEAPPTSRSSRRRRRALAYAAAIGVLVLAVVIGADRASAPPRIEVTDETITGAHAVLGHELWRREFASKISQASASPWTDALWLVGLGSDGRDGGRLHAIDRRSGETLWTVAPRIDDLRTAFDDSALTGGHFHFRRGTPADLDGDGTPEYASVFYHSTWFPAVVIVCDRDGTILGHYEHPGNVTGLAVLDQDDDGRDELLVTATVNSKSQLGAAIILLDHEGMDGGSRYLRHGEDPDVVPTDDAAVRLILPNYPAEMMAALGDERLAARDPRIYWDPDGEPTIAVRVGTALNQPRPEEAIIVEFDRNLRITKLSPIDTFVTTMRTTWPTQWFGNHGPSSGSWLREWAQSAIRYERGRKVPPASR